MKRKITLILLILSNIVFGQEVKKDYIEKGELLQESPFKISLNLTLSSQKYIAYQKRLVPSVPIYREYNSEQLSDPYKLLQAHLLSNNLQWNQKLFDIPENAKLTLDEINLKSQKQYYEKFKYEVICEYSFLCSSKEYLILMVNYKTPTGVKVCLPFVLEKQDDNSWRVSSNKYLIEFSGYLFIKPELLYLLFDNIDYDLWPFWKEMISQNYIIDQTIDISKGFFSTIMLNKTILNKEIVNGIFDIYSPPILKENIVKVWEKGKNGLVFLMNKDVNTYLKMYKYNPFLYFENQSVVVDYSSSPENAVSSWVFETNNDSLKQHSIGFIDRIVPKPNLPYEVGSKKILEFESKILFDYEGVEYAIVYFYQKGTLFDKVQNANATFRAGYRRVLLKKIKSEWVICDYHLRPSKEIDVFQDYPMLITESLDDFTTEFWAKILSKEGYSTWTDNRTEDIVRYKDGILTRGCVNLFHIWKIDRYPNFISIPDFLSENTRENVVDWFSSENAEYWKLEYVFRKK